MTMRETAQSSEIATLDTAPPKERGTWFCQWKVEKYWGDDRIANPEPYEVLEQSGNILTTVGAAYLLGAIIAAPGTLFNATNARVGVGTGTTTPVAADTDLTSGKVLQVVSSIPTVTTNQLTAVATFAAGVATQAWNEWGCFWSATANTGMINHAAPAGGLGTKASGASWTITVTISLT